MIALVTGATGCVGYALCGQLLENEAFAEVRVLVRGANADVPPGCRAFVGTLDDADTITTACADANIIFHAAAQVHSPNAPASDFERVNATGTANLLHAATVGGVGRVVYFSTVAVYGESTPPEGIAEDAPPAPATPYAQTKLRGEALVIDWARATGNVGVILRLATVYGARDRGNMARMADAVRRGRFVLPGSGANRKTVVAAQTVVQVAVNAVLSPDAPNGLPVVVADTGGARTLREIALGMARSADVPDANALRSVPLPMLRAVASVIETMYRTVHPGKSPPITRAQVDRLAADNVYLTGRMARFFRTPPP